MQPLSRIKSSLPDLTGRVAVVTGGARGIGSGIVAQFAAVGASVVVWDLDESSDDLNELRGVGLPVVSVVVDVSNEDQVVSAVGETMGRFGRLDILVNNAGIGDRVSIEQISSEFFHQRAGVNLFGSMICTKAAFPVMVQQGGGKFVNVSSVSAKVGGVSSRGDETAAGRSGPVYAATKGGVISMTRWVAKTGGELGILANAVCPGPVATDAISGATYDLSSTPLARVGSVDDVAQAVLYLGSQMSNYVTGQTINVDGGLRFD